MARLRILISFIFKHRTPFRMKQSTKRKGKARTREKTSQLPLTPQDGYDAPFPTFHREEGQKFLLLSQQLLSYPKLLIWLY
ncbi:conserved hypothetical protein [Ricinus communis]|uniref:Uncharacterized protein n=1 Tax=Ricinus communis TaxID=3988 RepID=B9SG66_RICCO|nr:conserved hypothetical protein [Ricinus communis]